MHILNNSWISEFWYGFMVIIAAAISVIFYVHNNKKVFRQSLVILGVICLFSIGIHKSQSINTPFGFGQISAIDPGQFDTTPDFLGKTFERLFDFVKRRILDTSL